MAWKKFSRLSTNLHLGNTELWWLENKYIPLKTKAVLLQTLIPRSPTRHYLHFSYTKISNALNVLEVTEQNKMGHCVKIHHSRGKGGRSLKCFRSWLSGVFIYWSWQLPSTPKLPCLPVLRPLPRSSTHFESQLNNNFLSKLIPFPLVRLRNINIAFFFKEWVMTDLISENILHPPVG